MPYAPPETTPPEALTREALRYADSLYNLARRLCGSGPDAEDLVQDTYARALGAVERFQPGTNLRAWLFRILRNAHIDLMRRRRVDPMGGRLDVAASLDGEALQGFAAGPGPEQLRRLVAGEIEAALQALTSDARTVILLDLEGLTETEVAEVMGCSLGTVKSRLARARATLRGLLGPYARRDD